jgi:crossover junction endodeoxyribonuclease RusA
MTGETVTIILPLPPAILSPNNPGGSRGGRFARAAASKRYRRLAKEAVLSSQIETGPWLRATVQATFCHKQRRRRDDVNHLGMLKPAYDGVVEAGLLIDDDSEHLTTLPASFRVDSEGSRVELRFERTA